LRVGDYDVWRNVPLSAIEQSGHQELLNWFCLVGAMEALGRRPDVYEFVEGLGDEIRANVSRSSTRPRRQAGHALREPKPILSGTHRRVGTRVVNDSPPHHYAFFCRLLSVVPSMP
jgi:hypothetical protein